MFHSLKDKLAVDIGKDKLAVDIGKDKLAVDIGKSESISCFVDTKYFASCKMVVLILLIKYNYVL